MAQRSSRSKEEVGEIIKSILVAEKKASTIGMPIVELEEEYKAQDGTRIPYRALGYACLMDFLENLQGKGEIIIGKRGSMPVVYLCVDEKIAHVSALVSRQKDSSKRCSRGGKRNPITSRMYPRVNNPVSSSRLDSKTLADVLKLVKSAPNGINVARIIEYLRDRNILTVDDQQLIRQLREISHQVSVENATIYPIMTTKKKIINSVTPPKTNDNFTGEKKPSPAYRPAGLSDEEEDDDDEVAFEFVRASDRVQSTISASQNNNVNQFYQDSHVNNCDENSNARSQKNDDKFKREDYCDEMEILVNTRTRFRLEKLIQKHPDGIWCAELPNIYHQEYCVPLNYEDLGFGNLSDFAAHLPDIFHCVRLQENGDFKLFDAKAPKPELRSNPRPKHLSLAALHNIYESYRDETDPVPVLLSPTTSQRLVPEGVMTIGETVAQIFVTQLFSDNIPHIDVVVVDTVTPTLFWIQLLRKTQKFDRFMRDLHAFYTEHASKYPIPIVVLERGLNCACMFDNKWHRGVIKAVKANSTVTVFFYDYGTVKTYPPQDIHFLHRSFSSLPAQAIPCGLYNVKPISTEKWPYSVCQVFAEKVLDVPMVAMLGSIDADNNSMLIALTNTDGAVDFHISDWMISSGFAVYGKMGETVDTNERYEDSVPVAAAAAAESSPRDPPVDGSMDIPLPPSETDLYDASQQSPRVYNARYEMQMAKMREEMQSQFNAMNNQLSLMVQVLTSKYRQLAAEQNQNPHSTIIDDLLSNIKLNSQNVEQSVIGSELPPPLPPRPNESYTKITNGNELENNPNIQSFNENFQENLSKNLNVPSNFQKFDLNINCTENPFDWRTTVKTSKAPINNRDYQSHLKEKGKDDDVNSAMWNEYIETEAFKLTPNVMVSQQQQQPLVNLEAPANVTYQEDPRVSCSSAPTYFNSNPQETQVDPISLITRRKTFEMSLEESAKSFFARMDAKNASKFQETNPFKIDIEKDKFQERRTSAEVLSSFPSRNSVDVVVNPFAREADPSQRDNNISSSGRLNPYPELPPVNWDFSTINKGKSELNAVENKRVDFETTKQINVASWIINDGNSKQNFVNKDEYQQVARGKQKFDPIFTGDFPSRLTTTVMPIVSGDSTTRSSNTAPHHCVSAIPLNESLINNQLFKSPKADLLGTYAHPTASFLESERFRGASGHMDMPANESYKKNFDSYGEKCRNIPGELPLSERIKLNKRLVREETDGSNDQAKQTEVSRAEKTWHYTEVQLTKQKVHLINVDNEGWLTVEEFMTVFTTYKMPEVILKILNIQNAQIPFRFIQRINYPTLFDQLERTCLAVPRNHKNQIGDVLHLVPLKSLLKMLRKLKIVDLKEVELATKERIFPSRTTALYDAYTIIFVYANIKSGNS